MGLIGPVMAPNVALQGILTGLAKSTCQLIIQEAPSACLLHPCDFIANTSCHVALLVVSGEVGGSRSQDMMRMSCTMVALCTTVTPHLPLQSR